MIFAREFLSCYRIVLSVTSGDTGLVNIRTSDKTNFPLYCTSAMVAIFNVKLLPTLPDCRGHQTAEHGNSVKPQQMAASTNRQGWAELLPARVANTPLRGKFRTSWTVIGAGFTGLAAARRLAELDPNDSIIVLDAGELAQNASGRNSGFVVATSDFSGRFNPAKLHEYQRINRINQTGLDLLRDLVRRYKIDCQWRESGFYRTGADKRAVQKVDEFLTYLEALGVPHRLLAREQTATELGTDHYRRAIHVDGGALVQPAALCFGLAAHLPTNVTLFENSPLLHIRPRTAG
ncbi:MAG TPA: FAD-binding oxidoreductase, partial [Rhizobiales bacterium]|nr:FAD-binding oxidoreductase [Hyphomicrobiales bacterium]